MRWLPLLAVAALLVAGCNSPSKPKVEEDPFEDAPEAAAGLGVIRGIVVDPALTPVVEAMVSLVSLARNQTTNDQGAFVFADLEPGTYFLQVSKLGWTSVQQSVDVVADVDEPPIVKVAIERVPGSEPRALTVQQDGFLGCSVGTPINYFSCDASGSETPDLWFDIEGVPRWIQTEVKWTSTQPLGDYLYLIQGICSCDGGVPGIGESRFNETPDAQSPYTARADPEFLQEWGVGTDEGRQVVVSVSASGPEPQTTNGSGVALNQAFQVFVTFFYNLDPDPDWTFVEDGPYEVPPS